LRWAFFIFLGLLLVGLGLVGYFRYRSSRYLQGQWQDVRAGIYQSTPTGYSAAIKAARKIIARCGQDPEPAGAVALGEAARAIELGDERLKAAQEALKQLRGTESEWRTAAQGYLALLEDPDWTVGYLHKGLEVHPESAILHYLKGRALAVSGSQVQAAKSFQRSLDLAPGYLAARIALAVSKGQRSSGLAEAFHALDEITTSSPNNVQALIERVRLCLRYSKEIDRAVQDARKVTGELAPKASRGQLGWAHLLLAQVAGRQRRYEAMSAELDQAIKSLPCCNSFFPYEMAGELMKLYRMIDAHKQMRRALEIEPKKKPEYILRIARVLLELDDTVQAAAYLEAAPAWLIETRILMGRLAYAQHDYPKASGLLERVLQDRPEALEAAVYRALAQARQRKMPQAIKALKKLGAEHPGRHEVQQALTQVSLWAGDYITSKEALKAAWKITKLDPRTMTIAGQMYLKMHQLDTAKKRFERALRIRPEYRQARIGLAILLLRTGHLSEARKQTGLIPKSERNKADVHALNARIAMAEKKLDAVRSYISQAENAGAARADIARLAGELALARGQGKLAIKLLKEAIKLSLSTDVDLLALLGQAQLAARELDQAYTTFIKALKKDRGHPVVLLELGRLAVEDGEYTIAIKNLKRALSMIEERSYPQGMAATAKSALGMAYLRSEDTGRAISTLQDAIELDPNLAQPHYTLAQTYDQLESPQRAIQFYNQALRLDPSRGDVHRRLGRLHALLQDTAMAIKSYQSYLASKPPAAQARKVRQELQKLQHP